MHYIVMDCHITTLDFAVVNEAGRLVKTHRVATSVNGFMKFVCKSATVPADYIHIYIILLLYRRFDRIASHSAILRCTMVRLYIPSESSDPSTMEQLLILGLHAQPPKRLYTESVFGSVSLWVKFHMKSVKESVYNW